MKTLLSFFFIAAVTGTLWGQERVIPKTEFNAAVRSPYNPSRAWKGKAYRLTISTSSSVKNRPQTDHVSRSVSEIAANGDRRFVRSSRFGCHSGVEHEEIRVGQGRYIRTGSGEWTKKTGDPLTGFDQDSPAPASEARTPLASEIEYRFVGNDVVNGRRFSVYRKIQREKYFDEAVGTEVVVETVTNYFVDTDGNVVKSEFRSTSSRKGFEHTTTVTMEWELDPAISIKAPAIAGP
jgi:hypothetical protein